MVRFGNVLYSSGSVIPLFKKQISSGGPVTVTDSNMVRYFMTIPEAVELVIQAGAMGKGGDVFVLDMGKPVKIVDLAKRMIQLSGLIEDEDIEIQFTGLRPGEKLFEELLSDKESNLSTHHPKILIAETKKYELSGVQASFETLQNSLNDQNQDDMKLVGILKQLVVEYKSQASKFEVLDN